MDKYKSFGKVFCIKCGRKIGRDQGGAVERAKIIRVCLNCAIEAWSKKIPYFKCEKKSRKDYWISTYTKPDKSENGVEWFCLSCSSKNKGVGRATT